MERDLAQVAVHLSLHELLKGLEQLAEEYPLYRLAPQQIDRIEAAARKLRSRLAEELEAAQNPGRRAADKKRP